MSTNGGYAPPPQVAGAQGTQSNAAQAAIAQARASIKKVEGWLKVTTSPKERSLENQTIKVDRSIIQQASSPPARNRNFGVGSGGSSNSLASLWIQAGGSPGIANIMAAIAMAESGGQVGIKSPRNTNGTYDLGLWQINSSHTQFNQQKLLSDPLYNAQAAVAVYKSQGFKAWTTYNNGAYKQFLGNASSGDTYSLTRPGGQPSGTSPGGSGGTVDAVLAGYKSGAYSTDSSVLGVPLLGLNFVQDLVGGIGSMLDAVKVLIWILNPLHILRAVEFLTGLTLMVFGIHAAYQGRSEAAEGFQTSEAAISRSGLGRVSRELAAAAVKKQRPARPKSAPHATRRQALRLRYEREQQVSRKRETKRRAPSAQPQNS